MPESITGDEQMDQDLLRYLTTREQDRADRVRARWEALSRREQRLVKEAAVMGYVLGHMAGEVAGRRGDLPGERQIPPDDRVVACVIEHCQSTSDLYPALGRTPKPRRPRG